MAEAIGSEMSDNEESNVSDGIDSSEPEPESPSEAEPTTSDEEYGSKEKRRRKHNYDTYFDGRSRNLYRLRKRLRKSLDSTESTSNLEGVCSQCMPGLTQIVEGFHKLSHSGTELKKRKKRYPNPKIKDRAHYRNLVAENAWIRGNIFDPMGNYLFCHTCVCNSLKVSKQRLSRQRKVKRKCFQQQETKMTKEQVEKERLASFVLMPVEIELCFALWWKSLPNDHEVMVRYPFERHGLAGRTSNSAKTDAKKSFLEFVDNNSQPNGRRLDSHNPTHYFLPKFTTITAPKKDVHNYDSRLANSLVGEFNRIQIEDGSSTISNYSATTWLKSERPKHAIYPHKADYCDFCAKIKASIQEKQTSINRKLQSGNVDAAEIQELQTEKESLETKLQEHKEMARQSLQYYKEMKDRCCEQWKEIIALEEKSDRSPAEAETLDQFKHCFTLVISADYQMQKLVPYWGDSPQPGCTYYFQKLSYDIFGIVDHRDESSTVYVFDERVGSKTADHTVSYILHYLKSTGQVPSWVTRVHIFLDNAGSTNKNQFLMSSCLELVQHRVLQYLRISFMIPGHTKFAPDLLFSRIAKSYYKSDVFNKDDLQLIAQQFSHVVIDHGGIVRMWREKVGEKYSSLPGIRELHDFVTIAMPPNKIVMKVREKCYSGALRDTPTKVKKDYNATDSCIPKVTDSYSARGNLRSLSENKMGHLKQMYANFIPQEKWPDFIHSP